MLVRHFVCSTEAVLIDPPIKADRVPRQGLRPSTVHESYMLTENNFRSTVSSSAQREKILAARGCLQRPAQTLPANLPPLSSGTPEGHGTSYTLAVTSVASARDSAAASAVAFLSTGTLERVTGRKRSGPTFNHPSPC